MQRYFTGSPDEVVITLEWSDDDQQLSQDNCTQFLMETVNTCSAPVRYDLAFTPGSRANTPLTLWTGH